MLIDCCPSNKIWGLVDALVWFDLVRTEMRGQTKGQEDER
jgi:hypothetical protein